eukprot:TRINITY_DN12395_c3_g3_i4.p1 TRINITY_DN12395_c3_g3~~TRINITY_DN12395_c3_g3_i4.p1  ORF type:complete len:129 (+),score=41.84 TRINITY_DN12395_c3_g3_i4:19-405(+)
MTCTSECEIETKTLALLTADLALPDASSNLLKFGSKEYYLKAGLCRILMGDIIAAKRAADGYVVQYAQFADSREQKLLSGLMDAVEAGDVDKFTAVLGEFDAVQKLDAWTTTICLRIKRTLNSEDDLL